MASLRALFVSFSLVAGCGARSGLDIDRFDASVPIDVPRPIDASAPRVDASIEVCEVMRRTELAVRTLDGPRLGAGPSTPALLAYTVPGAVPRVDGAFFDASRGALGPTFTITEGRVLAVANRASRGMLLLVERLDGMRDLVEIDLAGALVERSDAGAIEAIATQDDTGLLVTLAAEGAGTRWSIPETGDTGVLEGAPLSLALDRELATSFVALTRSAGRIIEHRGYLFGFESAATRTFPPESFAGAMRWGTILASHVVDRAVVAFDRGGHVEERSVAADALEHAVFTSGVEHDGALLTVRRGMRFAVVFAPEGPWFSADPITLEEGLGATARIAIASPSDIRSPAGSLVAAWESTDAAGRAVVRVQGVACPGFGGP